MTPETVTNEETRARIIELLAQARSAHQAIETVRLKHADPNWAAWYAGFLLERGFEGIWPSLTEARLAALLQEIDRDYQAGGAGGDWAEFTASRLPNTL